MDVCCAPISSISPIKQGAFRKLINEIRPFSWDKNNFTTPFQITEFEKYAGRNSAILDVGCGYGRTLNELHQLGFHNLVGIDFSSGMIERGKAQFPYLDLRTKETDSIDLPSQGIDAVILFAVLTCIPNNSEQEKLIQEINRVLKPNGILYINDFLLNDDERNKIRYAKFVPAFRFQYPKI